MDAFLIDGVRTPIGKFQGDLAELNAPRLGAVVIEALLQRTAVSSGQIDEVIVGNVLQAGVGQNPARQAALHAGLPDSIAAFTVNKVCGSGLKAAMLAAQAIIAGDNQIVIAGGMESMSHAPYLLPKARTGLRYGHGQVIDSIIQDGLWCAMEQWMMGDAAEHVAKRCQVSRADQDRFAAQSHQRAAAAWQAGHFDGEVVPVSVGEGAKARTIERDQGIRSEASQDSLARLKPVFQADGTVTPGNASQLSDGAAALLLASQRAVQEHGLRPLARVVSYTTSGVAPKEIFLAPVPAIRKLLEQTRLRLADIDLFELNEAFAAQMLGCAKELELDETRINVHGGAIAMGHPIGCSGARVLVTLLHALKQRGGKRGVAALCLGGGNAVAMLVEMV